MLYFNIFSSQPLKFSFVAFFLSFVCFNLSVQTIQHKLLALGVYRTASFLFTVFPTSSQQGIPLIF